MLKKIISTLLSSVLLVTTPITVSANTKSNYNEYSNVVLSEKIYDEAINEYLTLSVSQISDTQYRSQSYDSKGNIIYDYTYDSQTDVLTSNTSKETQVIGLNLLQSNRNRTRKIRASFKPYWAKIEISQKAIVGGAVISTALIATKIAPVLAPLCGLSVKGVTAAAKFSMSLVAGDIYSCISGGDWGKKVRFNLYYGIVTKTKYFDPFEGYIWVDVPTVTQINYLGVY